MNKEDIAIEVLSKQIIKAVDNKCNKLPFDKTYTGVISAVNYDGYTVQYSGKSIHIKTSNTTMFKNNDIVKICIPCDNPNNTYIVLDIDSLQNIVINGGGNEARKYTAKEISFDDTNSQLGVVNVQGAIDFLATKINNPTVVNSITQPEGLENGDIWEQITNDVIIH